MNWSVYADLLWEELHMVKSGIELKLCDIL